MTWKISLQINTSLQEQWDDADKAADRPVCQVNGRRIDLWHLATRKGYRLLTNFNGQILAETAYHTSCAVPKVMTHLQACLMSLRMQLALHSQVKHYLVNTLQHKGNNQLKWWHCYFLLCYKSEAKYRLLVLSACKTQPLILRWYFLEKYWTQKLSNRILTHPFLFRSMKWTFAVQQICF